jgi:hypothetical protein
VSLEKIKFSFALSNAKPTTTLALAPDKKML